MSGRSEFTPAEARLLEFLATFDDGAWISRMTLVAQPDLALDDLLSIGDLVERGLVQIEFYLATCRITPKGRATAARLANGRHGRSGTVIHVDFRLRRAS